MYQAHSRRPQQSWDSILGLLTHSQSQLSASLERGRERASLSAEGPDPPLLAVPGDLHPAP